MAGAIDIHAGDGAILAVAGRGNVLAAGNTVPVDGTTGYAVGCLFFHLDGGAGTALYCNEGTEASCDFDAVTVA